MLMVPVIHSQKRALATARVDMAIAGKIESLHQPRLPALQPQVPRNSACLLLMLGWKDLVTHDGRGNRTGKVIKGMQFSKKSDVDDFYKKVKDEVKMADVNPAQAAFAVSKTTAKPGAPAVAKKG